MADSPVIERAASKELDRHRRGQWLLVAGFVVLAAIVAGLAYWAWAQQARSLTQQAERSLNAVAKLKASQIAAWQSERRGDAELIRGDRLLSAAVSDLLAGRDAGASAVRARSFLEQMWRIYRYVDVTLVGPDGRTLMIVPTGSPPALGPRVRALVSEARRTGEIVSTDLYRGRDGVARIEMITPILALKPGDPPVACVVLHTDPNRFLYPFIQDWPIPSATGETLLVERRGGRVEYLNELRHRRGTALRLSASASDATRPAAMAVRGRRGIVEGVDYRGVPVMAAIAPVVATDWYVVAKVDKSEVLDPIRRRGWLTAGFTLLVVAAGGARARCCSGGSGSGRSTPSSTPASSSTATSSRTSPPASSSTQADTSIVLSNPAASRLLGLSADQLQGRDGDGPHLALPQRGRLRHGARGLPGQPRGRLGRALRRPRSQASSAGTEPNQSGCCAAPTPCKGRGRDSSRSSSRSSTSPR